VWVPDSGCILGCRSCHCSVSRSFDWFGAVSEVFPDETHCSVSLGDCVVNVLGPLEKWEEEWQMSFHPQKCTVIRIATNQRHVIPAQYTLHGHTLEVVDSAKYLGVTISEDLQWSKHILGAPAVSGY
jgi:hypothetical protein